MKKGRLIVISGPSGVGKGTVVKRLLARDPNTWLSVSATTRAIRPSETDGVQYHFISQAEFDRMIAEGSFLEYACYVDNSYGSPLAPIEQKLAEGRDVLLEIEVQGALQIKQKRPDAISVFIAAPSFEALAETGIPDRAAIRLHRRQRRDRNRGGRRGRHPPRRFSARGKPSESFMLRRQRTCFIPR